MGRRRLLARAAASVLRGMNHIFTGTPLRGPAGRKRTPGGGVSALRGMNHIFTGTPLRGSQAHARRRRECVTPVLCSHLRQRRGIGDGRARGALASARGGGRPWSRVLGVIVYGCVIYATKASGGGGQDCWEDVPAALQLTGGYRGMCHCASSAFVRLPKRRLYRSHGNRQVRHERNRVGLSAVAGRSGVAAIWICRRAVPPFSAAAGESSAGSRPRRGSSARPASAPRWRPP